jgi:hypothetical protein
MIGGFQAMRSAILAFLLTTSVASSMPAGPVPSSARRVPAIAVRVSLLPFAWIGSRMRGLFGHRHGVEVGNASILSREQGWTVLDLPVTEPARALYLEVGGRVQFDSAEIVFRDGNPRPLDLRGVVRGRGLFELHDCALTRDVAAVRLNVRAATERAWVGLRIARFDATPGDR